METRSRFRGHPVAAALFTVGALALQASDDQERRIETAAGERTLRYDFPAVRVGIAEYPDGPTGVTVLRFPNGASMAADIRGGSPGFVGDYGFVHAVTLAGGSLLGLEAAAGVAAELFAQGGSQGRWDAIPLVSGGIVYDFGGRDNGVYPDKRLGRAALNAVREGIVPLGQRGAGISVTVGNGFAFDRGEAAGQGAAFREVGGVKFLAVVVLNALGAVFDRSGQVVLGHLNRETGQRSGYPEEIERLAGGARPAPGNTTLTVIVTNQTMHRQDLIQLGRQVHASMARGIQPFHSRDDGDILWAVSTNEVEESAWSNMALGVVASETVWDAVLEARP
ncbi:MAG: P1 family peptidase [Gammaproteobacteria bacterium]|nr:P1 family peptidase [Gammaproteobacteria bacterium]